MEFGHKHDTYCGSFSRHTSIYIMKAKSRSPDSHHESPMLPVSQCERGSSTEGPMAQLEGYGLRLLLYRCRFEAMLHHL